MSEEDYRFRRPEHGYGTRLRLRRGERVDVTDPEDSHSEDEHISNSPAETNPPNSPTGTGEGRSGPSSPVSIDRNITGEHLTETPIITEQDGTSTEAGGRQITPQLVQQSIGTFLGTRVLATNLIYVKRALQFNLLPQKPVRQIKPPVAMNIPPPANPKVGSAKFSGSKKANADSNVGQFETRWQASGYGIHPDDVKKEHFASTL